MSIRDAERLKAGLDEDEARVSRSGPARVAWLTISDAEGPMFYTTVAAADDYSPWCADGRDLPDPDPASVRIVYDPARELRDIAAKRRILTRYEFACRQADVNVGAEQESWEKIAGALERDVADLAGVYGEAEVPRGSDD